MPIIVACPSCAGQLRVADDLIGRKVRCPACSTTFDAQAVPLPRSGAPLSSPAPSDRPEETEKVDGWKFLNLELTEEDAARGASSPPLSQPGPKKRQEIDSDDPIPLPPSSLDPPDRRPPPAPSSRARLNDEQDDVFPCPACGRMAHRDARRCAHCGERFGGERQDRDDYDEDRRPRLSRRPERRDTEPHRGGFILAMGIVSLALLTMCPWISVVPGMIAWICGQSDLRRIRQDEMDPEGHSSTQAGWICGIIGTGLSVVIWLGCGSIIGISYYNDIQRSRSTVRPRFAPTPKALPGQQ